MGLMDKLKGLFKGRETQVKSGIDTVSDQVEKKAGSHAATKVDAASDKAKDAVDKIAGTGGTVPPAGTAGTVPPTGTAGTVAPAGTGCGDDPAGDPACIDATGLTPNEGGVPTGHAPLDVRAAASRSALQQAEEHELRAPVQRQRRVGAVEHEEVRLTDGPRREPGR